MIAIYTYISFYVTIFVESSKNKFETEIGCFPVCDMIGYVFPFFPQPNDRKNEKPIVERRFFIFNSMTSASLLYVFFFFILFNIFLFFENSLSIWLYSLFAWVHYLFLMVVWSIFVQIKSKQATRMKRNAIFQSLNTMNTANSMQRYKMIFKQEKWKKLRPIKVWVGWLKKRHARMHKKRSSVHGKMRI